MSRLLPLLTATLMACGTTPDPGPVGPSVLLVTLDTTRADRIGAYGYPMADTPTLDGLAKRGTLFTRAYASQPLTIPAHSSIMTGRVPPSHGVRDNGDFRLSDDAITLAERFNEAGWTTAAFTAAFPTHRRWGFSQGFDHYSDPLPRVPGQRDWRDQRTADEVVNDAIDTLDEVDGPVFTWVHLFDAHWPYEPPEPWASQHADHPYDGEIAFADAQLGRLLRWWQAAHPDHIIVVTADHGEGLGDGGEKTHGFLLHDGTIRVPLIVVGPGMEAGARLDDPVSHIDIAPTLLDLAGLSVHPEIQGRDLREGGTELPYSEAMTGMHSLGLAPLIAWTDTDGRYTEGAWGAWYPTHGERVTTQPYGQDLTAHSARLLALVEGFEANEGEHASMDADALQMLAALGYLSAGDPTAVAGDVDPREVIDVIPLTWEARQRIGQGLLSKAERLIARLEHRMPDAWGVAQLRAQLALRTGDVQQATNLYSELFVLAPTSTVALQLAQLAQQRGDALDAEQWYREALALQPASPEAMAGLVRSLMSQGRTDEAEVEAQMYLDDVPDHAELMLLQAELMLLQGSPDRALPLAEGAVQVMPWSAWAHTVVGQALWERGEADPAIERLKDAVSLAPFDVRIRLRLSDCLSEVGRHSEAVRMLAPMSRILPEHEGIAKRLAAEEEAMSAAREKYRRPGTGYISIKGLEKK